MSLPRSESTPGKMWSWNRSRLYTTKDYFSPRNHKTRQHRLNLSWFLILHLHMHFHPFFLPETFKKKKCILTLPLKRTLWYWLLLVFSQYHQVPDEYFTSAVVLSLILAALFGLVYLLIIPQCVQQILFPWHSLSSFKWLSITLMLSSIALTRLSFHSGAQPYSSSSSSASASCWLVSCTCMSHGSRYEYSSIFLFRSLSVRYLNVQAHFLSQLWSQSVELYCLQCCLRHSVPPMPCSSQFLSLSVSLAA